ncbi:MAG: sugar phosphate isomerase/epimerase family protein, partial [Planctomycetota bacterium]
MAGISVQLYSVREQMAADTLGTLKRIADIGYAGVEPAGFGSLTAVDFKKAVDDLGMTVSSSHGPDVMSDFDGAVETAKTLGINWVSHMG